MIETTAIRAVNKDAFTITWNTGRRCNFDCSYCEDTFHNNYSRNRDFEDFKKTFDFVQQWTGLYNSKRDEPLRATISFTGGEPTVNPAFWKLLEYIRSQPGDYYLGLTTNGAWGHKHTEKVIKHVDSVTISYHAEADQKMKNRVLTNALKIKEAGLRLQVNLMMHMDHWDECVEVYHMFKYYDINVIPRPIGDGNVVRKGWFIDGDGNQRRTSHEYTPEQQEWYWATQGLEKKADTKAEGSQIGRGCCGGRCLEGKVQGNWIPITIVNTAFKDWYCSVDWFFLHIDQETRNVFHHQTCQALHDGKKGPIGNLRNADKMLADLSARLESPKPIVCPNERCGCGMCVPKAKDYNDFVNETGWKY